MGAICLGWVPVTSAEPPVSFAKPAKILKDATVTVRVIRPEPAQSQEARGQVEGQPDGANAGQAANVAVCSGVAVGDDLFVTYVTLSVGARLRITVPGGDQAVGEVRVVDHFSGLTLLYGKGAGATPVELAKDPPPAGAWVLGSAGWGVEAPVLSFGILSGKERSIRGASFPPLLQCDLRAAATSSGGGIVNDDGQLIGVVIAAEASEQNGGWTYAVPVRHVRRLLQAQAADRTVVLKRRRPVVGLVLEAGDMLGKVVVGRVQKEGPADKAGIQEGDEVTAVDGINIRAVYQAIAPVLRKQPGDAVAFSVRRNMEEQECRVILGGGIELPPNQQLARAPGVVDPRVVVQRVGRDRFGLQQGETIRNLAVVPTLPEEDPPQADPLPPDRRVELLEKAVDRYQAMMVLMREELKRRDQQQQQTETLVESLQHEIDDLRRRIDQPPADP